MSDKVLYMDEEMIKNIEQRKEMDLASILEQYETFERVYPYYQNMIENTPAKDSEEHPVLKSTMKKQEDKD